MLSGLAASAAITALIAGVAGAWSPCGFSMVDTIGTALGGTRRSTTWLACAMFTAGAVAGGAVTFGGLAFVGALVGGDGSARGALGAAIAIAAAVADWRGVRIAPQIRRQVPERWRWMMPLWLACGLYGVLLGLGFTTFVLAFATWALAGISFAGGDPALGLLIGLAFGVGRALPVLWMAPPLQSGEGARRLDGMAIEPRLWLGLRRLDALGLGLCALFLTATAATAAVLPGATDPSAGGGRLAWQQIGGSGVLGGQARAPSALPGTLPALGPSLIAWASAGQIAIADPLSLGVRATIPAARVDALAVSDSWVVFRVGAPDGSERLLDASLAAPAAQQTILGPLRAGEIGRPSLDGSTAVFALDTPRGSAIVTVDLASGARGVLRATSGGSALLYPSLLAGRLLYERLDRCAQELRIGPATARGGDRVLLSLPSTARRDPGYQRGYEHAFNRASLCPSRGPGGGSALRLGATALSASDAYVTAVPPNPAAARILTVARTARRRARRSSASPAPAPATGAQPCPAARPVAGRWAPDVPAAIAYAHARAGEISFAVRTEHRVWGWRASRTVPSASVLKAMLLIAYLDDPRVRDRALTRGDHRLIDPMIQESDNLAATRVLEFVGPAGVYAVARRAGMHRFSLDPVVWGLSRVDAADQTRFFLHVDGSVVARHRATAMHLLATVTPSQRWGIGQLALSRWQLYFKGGWGSGSGAVEHQVALLRHGPIRIALAVLITTSPSHAYAKRTLRGVFAALLRGVNRLLPPPCPLRRTFT